MKKIINWQPTTIKKALEFADGKQISKIGSDQPESDCQTVYFKDGSAIACKSDVTTYGECTPDDLWFPCWWIGVPEDEE